MIDAEAKHELSQNFADQSRISLTSRQLDALAFIRRFVAIWGRAPSFREIMVNVASASKGRVSVLVNALDERGHVRRDWKRKVELVDPAPAAVASLNGEPLIFVPSHADGVARA